MHLRSFLEVSKTCEGALQAVRRFQKSFKAFQRVSKEEFVETVVVKDGQNPWITVRKKKDL